MFKEYKKNARGGKYSDLWIIFKLNDKSNG